AIGRAHDPIHRPAQVDRGRPRQRDPLRVARRQHRPERARDPDRRRTPHREPPQRVDHLVGGGQAYHDFLIRQTRLVENLDRVTSPGHRGDHAYMTTTSPDWARLAAEYDERLRAAEALVVSHAVVKGDPTVIPFASERWGGPSPGETAWDHGLDA